MDWTFLIMYAFFGAIGGLIGFIIKRLRKKKDEFDVYELNRV